MINNFKTDLIIRVAANSQDELLKAMGYQRPTPANRERLQKVLECPSFGLAEGGFDFKYRSEDFLRVLCQAVGMNHQIIDEHISKLTDRLEEERRAFKPYIRIDTSFVRKNQPLFALAACDHQRFLQFSPGFWRYPLTDQLGETQRRVRAHVAQTRGFLGIWGEIKQYWFYYEKNAAYLFNLNGEVAGKQCGAELSDGIRGHEQTLFGTVIR